MRYPVYIPSRGRPQSKTAALLRGAGIPFLLVVEPGDYHSYAARWGFASVLTLPDSGRGIAFSRSWIKRTSERMGELRHWQLDDDVLKFARRDPLRTVEPRDALRWVEDLVDSFSNVGVASHSSIQWPSEESVLVNRYTYGTILVLNGTPFYWRVNAAEDGDFTLQNLAGGYATLTVKGVRAATAPNNAGAAGGNAALYAEGRQRLFEPFAALWPGVVSLSANGQKRIRWSAFNPALVSTGRPNPSAEESGLRVSKPEQGSLL